MWDSYPNKHVHSYIANSPIYNFNLPLTLITANQHTTSQCFLDGSHFLLTRYLYFYFPNPNPIYFKSILHFR